MSARFGYGFAIIHRHCINHEAADDWAITVARSIEGSRSNLFFRRTVARAYERRGNLNSALCMSDHELKIWGLWTARLDRLLVHIFAGQQTTQDVIMLWKKLNTQYPANECNLIATVAVAAGQTKMNWDLIALWHSVQSHTLNKDVQRIARGKLREINLNQLNIVTMLSSIDFGTYDFDNMRVALTAAYNRLEDLNPEGFWSSMIQRNPLPPTLLSIFRQKYLHIPSDPSCARFWMALRHCHPAPFSEKDDSLNAIACESDDCSTSEVIAALDYLAEAESQDTTVREIQHRLLNHSSGLNCISTVLS